MNMLHNAEMSLELCRSILAQHGQQPASMALRGLELHNVSSARMALALVESTLVHGVDALHAKAAAVQALTQAIHSPDPYGRA